METVEEAVAPVKRHRPYQGVNNQWPSGAPWVKLTPAEAISATKRLWRAETHRAFDGKVKARNIRGGRSAILLVEKPGQWILVVDHRKGWGALVHSLSHRLHNWLHTGADAHAFSHEMLEKRMVQMVIEKGWLSGSLKRPEKPVVERPVREVRRERVLARLATWERKAKRAATAIKKLKRQLAYYQRTLAA